MKPDNFFASNTRVDDAEMKMQFCEDEDVVEPFARIVFMEHKGRGASGMVCERLLLDKKGLNCVLLMYLNELFKGVKD